MKNNQKVGMPQDFDEARARGWEQVENKASFFIPKPGSVVTYQYQRGISTGHPRFPNFTRLHDSECDCAACRLAAEMRAKETAAAAAQQQQHGKAFYAGQGVSKGKGGCSTEVAQA